MRMDPKRLERLRSKYGTAHAGEVIDPEWRKVADRVFGPGGLSIQCRVDDTFSAAWNHPCKSSIPWKICKD